MQCACVTTDATELLRLHRRVVLVLADACSSPVHPLLVQHGTVSCASVKGPRCEGVSGVREEAQG